MQQCTRVLLPRTASLSTCVVRPVACHFRARRVLSAYYGGVKICQEERQRVVSNMRILRFDNAVKSLGPATQRQLFQAQGYKD